jgi:protoporphyrinogen oxidase
MIYDIILIGGGISGLNTCYELLKNNNELLKKKYNILLLEKNNYLGGRIKTFSKKIKNHKYHFEEGAGRLNDNHVYFLQLIKELNLLDKLVKINSTIEFKPSLKTKYFSNNYKEFIGKTPFYYIDKVIQYSKKDIKEDIQKYTFKEYCLKCLTKKEIEFIIDSFGYYTQLIKMNAYNALQLFDKGMNPKLQFYHVEYGFEVIIKELEKRILEKNGKIKLKTIVKNIKVIDKLFYIYTNKGLYISKKCVLAIPKPDLMKLTILDKCKKKINSIGYKSLCRIYAIFDKKNNWMKNIGKTTTNNFSRYIIPIDKNNGLIMISYSDGKYANYWNNLYKKNKKIFINKLKENIYKTFQIKINNPLFYKKCYWKCAVGYWKKNVDSSKIYKKIIHPYKNINLYICGENYSENQGWIEGALKTSFEVIKLLSSS